MDIIYIFLLSWLIGGFISNCIGMMRLMEDSFDDIGFYLSVFCCVWPLWLTMYLVYRLFKITEEMYKKIGTSK